jgi:DNA-binding transcriptional MerR regulator
MDASTVGAVVDLTGVSVRTLHHYDHIGLVVPSVRTPAGYRGYIDADIERLHLVLVYRSVGMPLDEIRKVLDDSSGDVLEHLRYLADERFTRYYDDIEPGLAQFVHDIVVASYP